MTHEASAARRKRGRPADGDSEGQRARLLAIAAEVFAETGPDATRVQQIADRAGVDRRLIYHYFQSRENLYVQVLRDHYERLAGIGSKLAVDASSVEAFMEVMMRRLFEFCRAHPQFVRILSWENLRDGAGLAQMDRLGVDRSVLDKLEPLVREEIAAGRCRADLDPRRLLVSALGMCFYVLTNRESLALVVDFRPATDRDWQAWIDHAVRQVVQGVRP